MIYFCLVDTYSNSFCNTHNSFQKDQKSNFFFQFIRLWVVKRVQQYNIFVGSTGRRFIWKSFRDPIPRRPLYFISCKKSFPKGIPTSSMYNVLVPFTRTTYPTDIFRIRFRYTRMVKFDDDDGVSWKIGPVHLL